MKPRTSRARSAMTVVEVIVALMLVSIGMLGLAGSTTIALRTTLEAHQRRGVVHRVESRIAMEQARGCTTARSGSVVDHPSLSSESWSVSAASNGFAVLHDSIQWPSLQGMRSFATTTAIQC